VGLQGDEHTVAASSRSRRGKTYYGDACFEEKIGHEPIETSGSSGRTCIPLPATGIVYARPYPIFPGQYMAEGAASVAQKHV